MHQKREQMWWLAACVVGLLVAAWAAGGFVGPLVAVFIVLFLAGAVLVEFGGGVAPSEQQAGPEQAGPEQTGPEQTPAEPEAALAPEVPDTPVAEFESDAESDSDAESEADLREAVSSLA